MYRIDFYITKVLEHSRTCQSPRHMHSPHKEKIHYSGIDPCKEVFQVCHKSCCCDLCSWHHGIQSYQSAECTVRLSDKKKNIFIFKCFIEGFFLDFTIHIILKPQSFAYQIIWKKNTVIDSSSNKQKKS